MWAESRSGDPARGGRPGAEPGGSVPWLESSEDFEDEGIGSGGLGRSLLLGVLLAAVLAVGIGWAVRASGPGEPDGSLIHAPSGPYKVRPDAPGGKTFAGTGDSAYAVSEGEDRGAALAKPEASPAAPAGDAAAEGSGSNGVGVQVGAYMDAAAAEAGWSALVVRNPVLSGRSHRVVEGRADIGTVYRLQAVAGSLAEANELCRRLDAAGQDCQVKR